MTLLILVPFLLEESFARAQRKQFSLFAWRAEAMGGNPQLRGNGPKKRQDPQPLKILCPGAAVDQLQTQLAPRMIFMPAPSDHASYFSGTNNPKGRINFIL